MNTCTVYIGIFVDVNENMSKLVSGTCVHVHVHHSKATCIHVCTCIYTCSFGRQPVLKAGNNWEGGGGGGGE